MSGVSVSHDYGRAVPAASAKLLATSVVLWVLGVIMIRFMAPFGLFAPRFSVALLLVTLPLAWGTVQLVERIGGGRTELLAATAVACVPAALLDGLAMTWARPIYGAAAMPLQAPAVWLLWFLGVSLAVALWRQMRHTAAVG